MPPFLMEKIVYKISVLLPSKWPAKREKFIQNLRKKTRNFDELEICICLDGTNENWQDGNIKYTYHPPTIYISKFFEAAYRISTAPWIFLANDDIEILTQDWDTLIDFSNPYKLFYFNDNLMGEKFGCHPLTGRRVWEICDQNGLVFPPYKNMGCDTTLWDVTLKKNKVYLEHVKIYHDRYLDREKQIDILQDTLRYNLTVPQLEGARDQIMNESSKEVKVLIGALTGEYARRADFYDYMNQLIKPNNTFLLYNHDRSPAHGRNMIIDEAIKFGCSHILFVDDDQAFKPEALVQLLEHDLDVVSGVYLKRAYPHQPLIFDKIDDEGRAYFSYLNGSKERLRKIEAAGFGWLLVKTEVFNKLERPYVRLGELDAAQWCDDIGFFKRLKEAGIDAFCDVQCRIGHIGTMIVWPERDEMGKWFTGYDTGTGTLRTPQIDPVNKESYLDFQKVLQR